MFATAIPRGPLSELVESFWLYTGDAPAHARDLRLPTGGVDLIVNLDRPGAVVSGPFTHAFELETADQVDTLGVAFKVGGAAAVLGTPLHALRDLNVELAELWGARGVELQERVVAAPTPAAKFELMERLLSARVARAPHPAAAPAAAHITAGCQVAALSDTLGLSLRRCEQVFRADIGMTPKAYQRLQRFRRALVQIEDATRLGWAEFALEHGYYDQAHMINEFGAHSGMTPRQYLESRSGTFVNHVPI